MRTIKSRDGMTREENDDYMLRDGESYIVGLMMMDSMRRGRSGARGCLSRIRRNS